MEPIILFAPTPGIRSNSSSSEDGIWTIDGCLGFFERVVVMTSSFIAFPRFSKSSGGTSPRDSLSSVGVKKLELDIELTEVQESDEELARNARDELRSK